jgi:hypothetical protein
MSETYAPGARDDTMVGKVIVIVASSLSALLVIAGLSYATGAGQRNEAGLVAAACEPGLSPSGLQCTTITMLTRQYEAAVTPASQQLTVDAAAYTANSGHDLAAAEAALTAEVASEHAFDATLAGMQFPPAVTPMVQDLIQANQARASLTAEQARSSSLTKLRSFNARVKATDAPVSKEIKLILKAVESPYGAG